MDLTNTGNIAGAPSKVVFEYEDYLTGTVIETDQNFNGLDSIAPFDAKTVIAEMPTYLPQGSYHVFYRIFDVNGTDILGQGTLDLSVLPPGTLTGYTGFGALEFWGLGWSERFETLGILLLALAILYGIYIGIRYGLRKLLRRGRGRVSTPPPSPPRHY